MVDEEVVEPTEERDVERTDNDAEVKVYTCEGCGAMFEAMIAKATHCRHCSEYIAWKAAEGEGGVYRGEGDANEILRHILTDFPGVTKAVVTEVMSWAELWGTIPPYYLPYLLGQMKGVAMGTANLITQRARLGRPRCPCL